MIEQRKLHIKKMLELGKSKEEIERELVAQGIDLKGYENELSALQYELAPTTVSVKQGVSSQQPLPSIRELILLGAQSVRAHVKEILIVGTITAGLSFAGTFLEVYTEGFTFLVTLLMIVASFFAAYALSYVVIQASAGANLIDGLSWTLSSILSILWIGVLTFFISVTGFALLIIPALIFSVYAFLTLIVLVREDKKGIHAIMRSIDLVRGAFWKIAWKNFVPTFLITLVLLLILLPTFVFVLDKTGDTTLIGDVLISLVNSLSQMAILVFGLTIATKLYEMRVAEKPMFDEKSYVGLKWASYFAAFIGFILMTILIFTLGTIFLSLLSANPSGEEKINWGEENVLKESISGLTFSDFLLQSQVKSTSVSARLFGESMDGSFQGVCKDIAVVEPITCSETTGTYALYAPLSNGTYYCVDSTGFGDILSSIPAVVGSCQ